MHHQAEMMFAAARAFLDACAWLGAEVLGDCDQGAIDALRAVVELIDARELASMTAANVLPI